jgi:hypothetical protein
MRMPWEARMRHGILILATVCGVISFLSFGAPKVHLDANYTLQACVGAADLNHRPLLSQWRPLVWW